MLTTICLGSGSTLTGLSTLTSISSCSSTINSASTLSASDSQTSRLHGLGGARGRTASSARDRRGGRMDDVIGGALQYASRGSVRRAGNITRRQIVS